jgi:epoxyqueuosine reductase
MPDILKILTEKNIKFKLINIDCLDKIKKEYESNLKNEILSKKLYKLYLESMAFDYGKIFPGARSILITSFPSFPIAAEMMYGGKKYDILVPPTYSVSMFEGIDFHGYLKDLFNRNGYRIYYAKLPQKYLAVRSGLNEYGRNNISYNEEYGSFLTVDTFLTDIETDERLPDEFILMDECRDCMKCINACPTKAIKENRFIIDAEKCITFMNENTDPIPDDMRKSIHNCWVGCMNCQIVCPKNENVKNIKNDPVKFTSDETEFIINNENEKFPENILNKLKILGIFEYSEALTRNLKLLILR